MKKQAMKRIQQFNPTFHEEVEINRAVIRYVIALTDATSGSNNVWYHRHQTMKNEAFLRFLEQHQNLFSWQKKI